MTITRPAGWLTAFCGGSLVLTFTPPVLASGYHFGSQSVSAQGTAHANGAEAADPSVIFYNPAGLARRVGWVSGTGHARHPGERRRATELLRAASALRQRVTRNARRRVPAGDPASCLRSVARMAGVVRDRRVTLLVSAGAIG